MTISPTHKPSMLPALSVFATVARTLSFAKAGADLRISSAAVSKTVKQLEAALGARLLNRTTRSVSLTDAGSQLLKVLEPAFASVDSAIDQVRSAYDQPGGELRLNTSHVAYATLIEPHLAEFLRQYPGLNVEITIDNVLSDIVGGGYDAGLRLGHTVQQDMVGVPVGARQQRVVVASPGYLSRHGTPKTPQDLVSHKCIRQRLHTRGPFYEWQFRVDDKNVQINVEGNVVFDEMRAAVNAACDDAGLAYVFKQFAQKELAQGRLTTMLEQYCPAGEPFYLYYPHRTQMPAKLRVFVDYFKDKCS